MTQGAVVPSLDIPIKLQSDNATRPELAPSGSDTTPSFGRVLDDAMLLLTHAAETGTAVDEATRTSILSARAATNLDWNCPGAANLLAALATLAAKLKPVTADSLRASCSNSLDPDIRSLRRWTYILTVPIIVFSVLSFVSSSIATGIRTDITTANALVVKLRGEVGTPDAPTAGTKEKPALPAGLNEGDVITELQQYASTVRAIDAQSRQLNWFVLRVENDPYAYLRSHQQSSAIEAEEDKSHPTLRERFQLPVPLGVSDMPKALDTLTTTLQDVRSFAQDVLDLVSVWYGAVTACLLPILYALLGTCAYLLRNFEEELRTLTFVPSAKTNWARFLIAGIGGAVVGLFNFVLTQGASVSPLAIAFLVGYAVDVFFSFLEGLLQTFTKSKSPASSPAAALSPGQQA